MAKKWNSPLWFNMYYSPNVPDYQAEMWAGALTGGRIDYHPLWPVDENTTPHVELYRALLRGGLMRGDCRVRLLNFITRSALDCPVAVVFGQPCAMNWAGPAYDDVGLGLSDALWQAGYPADLIPTTEIWTGALSVERGWVCSVRPAAISQRRVVSPGTGQAGDGRVVPQGGEGQDLALSDRGLDAGL